MLFKVLSLLALLEYKRKNTDTLSHSFQKPLWDPDQFNAFMDDFRRCLTLLEYEATSVCGLMLLVYEALSY